MIPAGETEQTAVVKIEAAGMKARREECDSAEAFFQVHAAAVYAYAIRRVGNPSVAEDVTAEVFLAAVRHSKKRLTTDPLPWLYGIAQRKVADYFRAMSRSEAQGLTDSIPASTRDPHGAAELSERCTELRRVVDALPADQREALLLHYVEGLAAQQVAEVMQKSVVSVNSLLQRARQKLRDELGMKGEVIQ